MDAYIEHVMTDPQAMEQLKEDLKDTFVTKAELHNTLEDFKKELKEELKKELKEELKEMFVTKEDFEQFKKEIVQMMKTFMTKQIEGECVDVGEWAILDQGRDEECPCCMESMVAQKCVKWKCGHVIHGTCADEWVLSCLSAGRRSFTCPSCRYRVTP